MHVQFIFAIVHAHFSTFSNIWSRFLVRQRNRFVKFSRIHKLHGLYLRHFSEYFYDCNTQLFTNQQNQQTLEKIWMIWKTLLLALYLRNCSGIGAFIVAKLFHVILINFFPMLNFDTFCLWFFWNRLVLAPD